MPQAVTFRSAVPEDCTQLAVLADMATRRLTSHLWGLAALPGQSAFEVGRNLIRDNTAHFSHVSNWRVAEHQGHMIGAVNGYVIPKPNAAAPPAPEVVQLLNELKALAVGTWYASAIALLPEHQGQGFGIALLREAQTMARTSGSQRLTLMVGSFNARAHRLYLRDGFNEWARRPFTAFPGSDVPGEWILMAKELA